MRFPIIAIVILSLASVVCAQDADVLVIRNATVIDVSGGGLGVDDITGAVVVIQGERIAAVGPAAEIDIPAGARILDAQGGFLVPGLIDCFAALNHQGQANAYLAQVVTTILAVESTPRGPMDHDSDP